MYSDQLVGGGRGGGGVMNRKRSVRDRLGGSQDQSSSIVRPPKRARLEEGKWKHDLYEEKEDIRQPSLSVRQPSLSIRQPSILMTVAGGQDLRLRLGRRNNSINSRGGQGEVSSMSGVKDLREKLSGPIQTAPVNRESAVQRRLASVVRGSSGLASLATARPGISRYSSAIPHKGPMLQTAPVHKAQPLEIDENSIAGLLQSLGLSKYLITFQAEEVDMAALRHMGDDDLKELGVPMGPRKKILLAVGAHG